MFSTSLILCEQKNYNTIVWWPWETERDMTRSGTFKQLLKNINLHNLIMMAVISLSFTLTFPIEFHIFALSLSLSLSFSFHEVREIISQFRRLFSHVNSIIRYFKLSEIPPSGLTGVTCLGVIAISTITCLPYYVLLFNPLMDI